MPHLKEGDLLHPEPEPQSVLEDLRKSMGSANFSAQYVQRPMPAGITALVRMEIIYIPYVVRSRLEYPALKKRIIAERQRRKADYILIDDEGSGMSLI